MAIDPVSASISIGFKALGGIFGSKGKKRTAADVAKTGLAQEGYRTPARISPSSPRTGRLAKAAASAEVYDYYQMVAKAKLVADRLDPEKGTQVGEFGAIKAGSLS
jgi:hypothetical protein